MAIMKKLNKFNLNQGVAMLEKFQHQCASKAQFVDARCYHFGIKSLFNDNNKDTIYTNGVLTLAEGLSPRWLLMR